MGGTRNLTLEKQICELRTDGHKYSEIAIICGCTKSYVGRVIGNNGLQRTGSDREARDKFIAEHGAEYTWKELSDMFNTGEGTIHRVAKMYGVTLKKDEEAMRRGQKLAKKIQRDNREAELYNKVKERLPQFEYVGNYKPNGDKSTLDVRCTICGTVKTIQVQALRHRQVRCDTCYEKELQQYHEQKKAKKQREQYIKDLEKKAEVEAKSQQIKFNLCVCKECGKTFASIRKVSFCSDECRRKAMNRKKDRRIKPEQIVDNISLPELYRRDEGICYICGTKCDWDDYTETVGSDNRMAKIVGPTYPTIEHVKPICKGGLHSWGNVRLACFECNTKKSSYWEE